MVRRIKAWLLNPVVAAGLWLGLLGALSNNYVIVANGGMPVCGRSYRTGIHIAMTDRTRLNWLADWIRCSNYVLSPGDLLIYGAMFLCTVGIMRGYIHADDRKRIS